MDNRFGTFTMLLSKISKNIRKIKNKRIEDYGLKSIHVSIIFFIYFNKTMTATELCEKCEADKATVSRTLEFLENENYLICDSKYSKRYNSPFELTKKGLELGKDITERIQNVLLELDDCLTEAERKQFYESFTKISNKLNDICEKIYKEEK